MKHIPSYSAHCAILQIFMLEHFYVSLMGWVAKVGFSKMNEALFAPSCWVFRFYVKHYEVICYL